MYMPLFPGKGSPLALTMPGKKAASAGVTEVPGRGGCLGRDTDPAPEHATATGADPMVSTGDGGGGGAGCEGLGGADGGVGAGGTCGGGGIGGGGRHGAAGSAPETSPPPEADADTGAPGCGDTAGLFVGATAGSARAALGSLKVTSRLA